MSALRRFGMDAGRRDLQRGGGMPDHVSFGALMPASDSTLPSFEPRLKPTRRELSRLTGPLITSASSGPRARKSTAQAAAAETRIFRQHHAEHRQQRLQVIDRQLTAAEAQVQLDHLAAVVEAAVDGQLRTAAAQRAVVDAAGTVDSR